MTAHETSDETRTYRLLLLGGWEDVEPSTDLARDRWSSSSHSGALERLNPFVDSCDSVILHPNGPVPGTFPESRGLTRTTDRGTNRESAVILDRLRRLGIEGVNLVNLATPQLNPQDLGINLQALEQAGIRGFGAGLTLQEARLPYRVTLPSEVGGGEIHLHGFLAEGATQSREPVTVRSSMLRLPDVPSARSNLTRPDSLQIALPAWGRTTRWRTNYEYQLAHRLLSKDYDLVLGQGGSTVKEVHRKLQRWVVYDIGGGVSQWSGETGSEPNLPILLRPILEVRCRGEKRTVSLKLYPVYSHAFGGNGRGKPVSKESFADLLETLSSRSVRPWRFNNQALTTATDPLGQHLSLDLGSWPIGRRPARLDPASRDGDPGEWPFRGPRGDLQDRVLAMDKHIGAALLSLGAESEGGKTQWLSKSAALIQLGDKRLLARGYWGQETPVGTAIAADKVLMADLLEKGNVLTPATRIVASADEAVQVAQEIGSPVVLKPRSGNKSKGVSTSLSSEAEIRGAFDFARQYSTEVIIQQHIDAADELRVMASSAGAVAAVKRLMPHVVGDGISTVRQLIDDKNLQRSLNPALAGRSIPIDALTHNELERRGIDMEYVPELREVITVRSVGGVSVGADTFQAFETISHDVKEAATRAVAAIPGLDWGGVDLLLEKETSRTYVIEVNAAAGYGSAVFPTYGRPRDVGSAAWSSRFSGTATTHGGPIELPHFNRAPVEMIGGQGLDPGLPPVVPFSKLLRSSLVRLGYTFVPRGAVLDWVLSPDGKGSWLRRDGMTIADRSVVVSVLKRHEWVLNLLDLAEVPRTRARRVNSMGTVKRFAEGRVSYITLAPVSVAWEDCSDVILPTREVLEQANLMKKNLVQARPSGRRFRILASERKAWVVTASTKQKPSDSEQVVAACRVAVEAVRAIPELRWCAVDVVVRPSAFREGRRSSVLVEGLTLRPRYSHEDKIIAGDMDEFCRGLIEGFSWRAADKELTSAGDLSTM